MRTSELQIAIEEEFGALGAVLMTDTTLGSLGGRTGAEALAAIESGDAAGARAAIAADIRDAADFIIAHGRLPEG